MIKQRQYRHTNEAGLSYWTACTLVAAAFLSLSLVGCGKKSESKSAAPSAQTQPTKAQTQKDGAANSANAPAGTTLVESATANSTDAAPPAATQSDKISDAFAKLETAGYQVVYRPETGSKPELVPTHKLLLNTDAEILQALDETAKALEAAQIEAGLDPGFKVGSERSLAPGKDLVTALNTEIARYQDLNYLPSLKRDQLEKNDGLAKNLQPIGLTAKQEAPNDEWVVAVLDDSANETARQSGESHNVLARLHDNLPDTDLVEPLRAALNTELQKNPAVMVANAPETLDDTDAAQAAAISPEDASDEQFRQLAKDAQALSEKIGVLQQTTARQRQEWTEQLRTRDQIIQEASEALDRATEASTAARQVLSRTEDVRRPAQEPQSQPAADPAPAPKP